MTAVTLFPEMTEVLRSDKRNNCCCDKYYFFIEVKMGVLHCLYKRSRNFETGTEGLNFWCVICLYVHGAVRVNYRFICVIYVHVHSSINNCSLIKSLNFLRYFEIRQKEINVFAS
jgi:hypothetical protein